MTIERPAVYADRGMVATSQPLAAQAGLAALQAGGTAVDAALAAAAALTVVEPTSNGLGGDAFAIVSVGGSLHGLNASGRWPAVAQLDPAATEAPQWGWPSVTVPGAVDGWRVLHERFGRLPPADLFAAARKYAADGYPVSPVVARHWGRAYERYSGFDLAGTDTWAPQFAPGGRAPRVGELWSCPPMARFFETLADEGFRSFYEGRIAEAIADYSAASGGWIDGDDLATHQSEWVEPISTTYRGTEVWELPPNGQGIAALIALGIMEHRSPGADELDADHWHEQIEAMKLAFVYSDASVGDPAHAPDTVGTLLAADRLAGLAAGIGAEAAEVPPAHRPDGGTVYLGAADSDGMMVSFIQSNYAGFGSGVVEPSFGIALQNRAGCFRVEPGHPNHATPGRRPRHTIIPGFLTRDGEPLGPFGVMGGEMQPQGHLQVVAGMIDHGLDPQQALTTPRWRVERDGAVRVEAEVPDELVEALRRRGHAVAVEEPAGFGRGQIILRTDDGAFVGGSEPRADGHAAGW